MHRQARHARDAALNRRLSLRRRIDAHSALLGRHTIRALRFDIKMFLPVHIGATFEIMRAVFKSRFGVAQFEMFWRNDQIVFRKSDARVGNDFERLDFVLFFLRQRAPVLRIPPKRARRAFPENDFPLGKQRLVVQNSADFVLPIKSRAKIN